MVGFESDHERIDVSLILNHYPALDLAKVEWCTVSDDLNWIEVGKPAKESAASLQRTTPNLFGDSLIVLDFEFFHCYEQIKKFITLAV